MIYQTIALYYVRLVNPDVYEQASMYAFPPKHWTYQTLRADETAAGNWTPVKDCKLLIPLENWSEVVGHWTVKIKR